MRGRFEQQKPRKSPWKVILIILLVLILLAAAVAAGGYFYLRSKFSKVNYIQMPPKTEPVAVTEELEETQTVAEDETQEATTEETTVETTVPPMKPEDIINILIVGQSGRPGEEALLADTMILLSMNTYTNTVTITSIMRDAFVKLPDYKGHQCGRSKMTFCYNLGYQWGGGTAGAMEMTNICLLNNFGIDVDYNVEVDFQGFINIIDYLGGVRLDLTEAEANYLNKDKVWVQTEVHEGENRLDGMTALCFARMRKAEGDSESDIKRTERQRRLLTALLDKLRKRTVIEANSMIDTVLPFITTNMDPDTMASLMLKIVPMIADMKIESGTCPYQSSYWGEMVDIFKNGEMHSVLKFDEPANKAHMRAITEGEGVQ